MNKKFKKILVSLVASAMCVTGSMGAISASAATNESAVFAFTLGTGETDYSNPATKLNYLSYGTVTPTSGNLSSSTYLYATIYTADKTTLLTYSYLLTELNRTTRIFYNTTTPSYGSSLRLRGYAGYYGVTVAGGWTP